MSAAFAQAALAIAAALFDSLWEGALIAGSVWLGLRCLPKLGAATRYAIWLCTLAALVLVPIATVSLSVQQPSEPSINATTVAGESVVPNVPIPQRPTHVPRATAHTSGIASEPAPTPARKSQITVPQGLAFVVALLWLLAASARALKLALDMRALAVVRRNARLWPAPHDFPVLLSDRVAIPLAAGLVRAAVILPTSLVEQLQPGALDTIIIHEVAHLRRYDVWTNALARILEAIVVLNPVTWFVMRRLSIEREIACDDWVVARTGSGDAFAKVLAGLAGRVTSRAPLAAASALGSPHALVERIERLLDARPRRLRLSVSALGGALVLLALVAFLLQSISPVLAFELPQPELTRLAQAAAPAGGKCELPNHGIRWPGFTPESPLWKSLPPDKRSAILRARFELKGAKEIVSRYGASNTAVVDLTVDDTGRPRKAVVVSSPAYPGMAPDVVRQTMINRFDPATRNCVPVMSTVRTALVYGNPETGTESIVSAVYPNGWSAQNASACKVPDLFHSGVPAFPAAMKAVPVGRRFDGLVGVHVNAAGVVTRADVMKSTGEKTFDDALLAAARQATYPMTEGTGFKPVRPSGAPLSWNAAHGSSVYAKCKPLPANYVWHTNFSRRVPIALPGMMEALGARHV